jgi:tetratricopeptide (TPR) repeat protein
MIMTTEQKSIIESMIRDAYRKHMLGEYHEAIYEYTRAIEICPCAEVYCFRAWAFSYLNNYTQAIEDCLKAIALDPDFGNSYNDIGAYMIAMGFTDGAIDYLEKAIVSKRYATRHFAHYNLGKIFEIQGRAFEAVGEYRRSLNICPDYKLAAYGLERITPQLRRILTEE